jgi:biopolymer transport protein TolR
MRDVSEVRIVAAPNVTPMIDVMLVLLIIFMVVTPSLLSGVVAEPPQSENFKARPEIETDHTLAIDAGGALYLDRRPIGPEDLGEALARLYPAGSDDRVLYLRAHRELRYEGITRVIDIARTSGVAVVGLVSEQRTPD